MAYQTGTSTGPADLLSKIEAFASDQGWTLQKSWSDDDGSKLLLSSGSQYVALRATESDIYLRGATDVDTDADWDAQPGTSPQSRSNKMPGPYTAYHLFGTSQYIHCVVEITAGVFKHLVFGSIDAYGSVVGGAYVGAICWYYNSNYYRGPTHSRHCCLFDYTNHERPGSNDNTPTLIRADIDGAAGAWAHFGQYTGRDVGIRAAGPARDDGFCSGLFDRSPNTLNALTPLIPVYVLIERPNGLFSPMGTVPDMRYCNCDNITPGDTITIGTDDYMVFPFIQKNGGTSEGDLNSGNYAWAYKKVP